MKQIQSNRFSSEVKDILAENSSWMTNWGITSVLMLLLLLVVGSYFYKYPDLVIANVVITTKNPPISMIGKVNGKIDVLFVEDGQAVKKKQVLLIIENTANFKDIQDLKSNLKILGSCLQDSQKLCEIDQKKYLALGPIQDSYSTVLEDYDFYARCIRNMYFKDKIISQKKQLSLHKVYYANIIIQNKILKKQLLLAAKDLNRDSLLLNSKVISESEFQTTKKNYFQKLYSYQEAESSLSNVDIKMEEIRNSSIDIKENDNIQLTNIKRSLQKKVNILLSEISKWEDLYVIKSPIEGRVSFSKFYAVGLNTIVGETIISIIPNDSTALLARAETSMKNAGKLEEGLKVNIKLENYPYTEYGLLKGTVSHISQLPENKLYYININLNRGLETSLKKKLPLSQRMSGTAEIITKDKRLIERIIAPLITLLKD